VARPETPEVGDREPFLGQESTRSARLGLFVAVPVVRDGNQQHRHVGIEACQCARDLKSALIPEANVEQDRVGCEFVHSLQRCSRAVRLSDDRIPARPEKRSRSPPEYRLIVDDQHAQRRARAGVETERSSRRSHAEPCCSRAATVSIPQMRDLQSNT